MYKVSIKYQDKRINYLIAFTVHIFLLHNILVFINFKSVYFNNKLFFYN